jgi:hypothetical protein
MFDVRCLMFDVVAPLLPPEPGLTIERFNGLTAAQPSASSAVPAMFDV